MFGRLAPGGESIYKIKTSTGGKKLRGLRGRLKGRSTFPMEKGLRLKNRPEGNSGGRQPVVSLPPLEPRETATAGGEVTLQGNPSSSCLKKEAHG